MTNRDAPKDAGGSDLVGNVEIPDKIDQEFEARSHRFNDQAGADAEILLTATGLDPRVWVLSGQDGSILGVDDDEDDDRKIDLKITLPETGAYYAKVEAQRPELGEYTIRVDVPNIPSYTLTVDVDPEGSGIVDVSPTEATCLENTEITRIPQPTGGFIFDHWSGDVPQGRENDDPLTITMDAEKNITANFAQAGNKLRVKIDPRDSGAVQKSPEKKRYQDGEQVALLGLPGRGCQFDYWSGAVPKGRERNNPLTLTMNKDRTLTSHFVRFYKGFEALADSDNLRMDLARDRITGIPKGGKKARSSLNTKKTRLTSKDRLNSGIYSIVPKRVIVQNSRDVIIRLFVRGETVTGYGILKGGGGTCRAVINGGLIQFKHVLPGLYKLKLHISSL